jgi:Transcriptional regulator
MKSKRLYYLNKITNILLENKNGRIKIDDLATAIGVTKKTLYNYFESKQQLNECIIDNYIRQKINEIRAAIKDGQNPIAILLMISEILNHAYKDCSHLLTPLGKIRNTNSFAQIMEANRNELVEITQYNFKKGIREGLFEVDIDTMLLSKLFLSNIQTLSSPCSLINLMLDSKERYKQIIFYMLKGSCTPEGLQLLRHMIDIKVTLSDNSHEKIAICSPMLAV